MLPSFPNTPAVGSESAYSSDDNKSYHAHSLPASPARKPNINVDTGIATRFSLKSPVYNSQGFSSWPETEESTRHDSGNSGPHESFSNFQHPLQYIESYT